MMESNCFDNGNEMPLVTIGIPVYNVEPYIKKCLFCVLNQTYTNMEVLVVDDLGSDNSMAIVEELQRTHLKGDCIRVIVRSQNGGSGEARNAVISQAKGDYVYFLDSDDYIEDSTIELMVKEAEEHHTDVVIASLRKVVWNTNIEQPTLQYSFYRLINGTDEFAKFVCQDLRWHIAITACNILFKTSFLRDNNLFFRAKKDEDALFLSDYYSEVNSAVIMPNVTYNYVIRPNSKMGNNARKKIPVAEIRDRFVTDAIMTNSCIRLKGRPFYETHCARVVKHKFRAVCVALRHRHRFTEKLSNQEIRQEMTYPVSLNEIVKFRRYVLFHIFFFLLSKLPPSVFVVVAYGLGKLMKWI